MLWRAINLSLLLGGILYLPTLMLHCIDFWFLPPGQGFLNSDARPMPESEVLSQFLLTLATAPLMYLAISTFIFALQLPFLTWQWWWRGAPMWDGRAGDGSP